MNKVILGLILAVCVLGMALMMLNERLGRKPDAVQPEHIEQPVSEKNDNQEQGPEAVSPPVAMQHPEAPDSVAGVREFEQAEAKGALGAPERLPESAHPVEEKAPVPRMPVKPEIIEPRAPRPAAGTEEKKSVPVPPVTTPKTSPQTAEKVAKPAAQQAAQQRSGGRDVTRFVVFARDKGATIRIAANSKLNYKSITLENPDRVVVDIDGDWKFPPSAGIPKNDMVSNVRVGQNGDKTRVVIDLKSKPRSVRLLPAKNGDGVDVRVDK